jgi:hypothetical protein
MTDPELIYLGEVTESGEIRLPKRMRADLLKVFAGKNIEVKVRRKRSRRSLQANNYYWGCVVSPILYQFRQWDPETGWTLEMVHAILKEKFLPKVREWSGVVVPETGEYIPEPLTTTKLTKSEFSDYTTLCAKYAAQDLGIDIEKPAEQTEMNFAI